MKLPEFNRDVIALVDINHGWKVMIGILLRGETDKKNIYLQSDAGFVYQPDRIIDWKYLSEVVPNWYPPKVSKRRLRTAKQSTGKEASDGVAES